MQGTSPEGEKYVDRDVPWMNYSCAVHGFQPASYGSTQSIGCVELPVPAAEKVYQHMDYGTLVTVDA